MTDTIDRPNLVAAREPRRVDIVDLLARYGMLLVLLVLVVLARMAYPGFLDLENLRNILGQNVAVGLTAIGMTFVLIGRGFDLSVGATYALATCLFAGLTVDHDPLIGGIMALTAGVVVGVANGILITKLDVNPFVATLGSSSIISGLAYIYSDSRAVVPDHSQFRWLGTTEWLTLPVSVWILAAVAILSSVALTRTLWGRHLFSVGGNPEASRLSGLRVSAILVSTYALTALMATLAGMIDASKLGVGQANVGQFLALDAIAVVVIGGTSLKGGEGAIWRTIVGLFILATLTNLFYSLNVSQNWQYIAKGAIVIGAVALDSFFRKRRGRVA